MTRRNTGLFVQLNEGSGGSIAEPIPADRLDCALVRDEPGLPERPRRGPLYGEKRAAASPTDHRLAV